MWMACQYDPRKDARNRRKHGISLARFDDMVPSTQIATADLREDYGEDRWSILGLIDGRVYMASVTYRNDEPWVISLRAATRREQETHDAHFRS